MKDRKTSLWLRLLASSLAVALLVVGSRVQAGQPEQALVPRYRITTWGTAQGLPDARVQAVLQTRDGYLWVGTVAGLARFDGTRFRSFTHRNAPEFKSDNCLALAEDAEGALWIGTAYGLIRFADRVFTRVEVADGMAEEMIRRLEPASGGGVWAATRNAIQWVGASQMGEVFPIPGVDILTLAFRERLHGRPQLLTEFYQEEGATGLPVVARLEADHANLLRHEFTDAEDTLWVASANRVYRRQPGRREFELVLKLEDPHDYICALLGDAHGTMWVAKAVTGLTAIHRGGVTEYDTNTGFPGNFVHCLATDYEGNVWAGVEGGGLVRLRPITIRGLSRAMVLSGVNSWAVLESRNRTMWVATDEGATAIRSDGLMQLTELEGLPSRRTRALLEDRNGAIWIGTGKGLARWQDHRLTTVALPPAEGASKIRTLFEDSRGRIWVGTANGVHRFNDGAPVWLTTTNGLPHGDVKAIWEDPLRRLWFGTGGGGIGILDGEKWLTLTTTNGLHSDHVSVLATDADGRLWAGTANGLSAWNDGQFMTLSRRNGLLEDIINGVVDDRQGGLWLSGNEGVYRCDKQDLSAFLEGRRTWISPAAFDVNDGLPSSETNGERSHPTTCRTADGELWFPTVAGVGIIQPDALQRNLAKPTVLIETVLVDNQCVWGDEVAGEVEPPSPDETGRRSHRPRLLHVHKPDLVVPPGLGRLIELRYTANIFTAPEHARFRYRMEGVDADWVEAGDRRAAFYTALKPGHYRFSVTACNSHGVWSDAGASFALQIQPLFYQTRTFLLVVALSLVALGAVLYHLREGLARRVRVAEEASLLERERTRIAHDIHDDLGARLTRIVFLSQMAEQNLPRPSLPTGIASSITESARDAVQSLAEVVWATNPRRDDLDSLATFICQQAEKFVTGLHVRLRLDIQKPLPEVPLTSEIRHNLFRVVKEALNNALKHSRASEVQIRLRYENEFLTVVVEDNGAGFDPRAEAESGNGLQGMQTRMKAVGGQFEIQSQLGRGTCVTLGLRLPLVRQKSGGKENMSPGL